MSVSAQLVDNSAKDNTGDAINGSEVDANPQTIADILDGTTVIALGTVAGVPFTAVDINGGTIDGVTIGGASAGAGTFTTLVANTSITGTLATASQPNITALGTIGSLVATTADINAGTVDAVIGGTTPAAGTFTTLAGTTSVVAASDITITSGSILSASGAITFGDENLSTTGTLGAGATTVTSLNVSDGNITNVGDIALDSISADGSSITVSSTTNFSSGNVYIGDTTNASMTQGLTINQGTNDNEIFALKSTDVAHGVTDTTETDTFFSIRKTSLTSGGVQAQCFSEDDLALNLWGVHTNDSTTKTTGGSSTVRVTALKKNGTTIGGPGANANLFSVFNGGVGSVFIVDAEGDLYADGGTSSTNMVTQYDEYEDAQLIRAFSTMGNAQSVIKDKWDNFVSYNEDTLVELGILGAPLKDKPLYCVTKLQKLQNGAIWQLYTQIMDMAERIEENVPQLRGKLIPQIGA